MWGRAWTKRPAGPVKGGVLAIYPASRGGSARRGYKFQRAVLTRRLELHSRLDQLTQR